MTLPEQNFTVKTIDKQHAIWFRESHTFLLLEEPAWDVFLMYRDLKDRSEIVAFCRQKYGQIEPNISGFVNEVTGLLHHYNSPAASPSLSKKHRAESLVSKNAFEDSIYYRLGNKLIELRYGDKDLLWAIHPLLEHLATKEANNCDHVIECFENDGLLVCRYNNVVVEAFEKKNMEYFTGNVKQLMYSIVYEKDFSGWMSMLHASGVQKAGKSVLFSAAAGSGKTTISALLKAQGYGYLSDDMIAADEKGNAYSFPAAISVKEGSLPVLLEYYPDLHEISPEETFIGKSVRYLPVFNLTDNSQNGFPVKAFVFVKYSKEDQFEFEPIMKAKALELLLRETWVNPRESFVKAFFEWVEQTPFYRLHYNTTKQALDAMKHLFEDDHK